MLNERIHVLLELWQPRVASERFVVAEEGENDIGLGIGQLEAVFAYGSAGAQLLRLRHGSRAGQPLVGCAKVHRAQPAVSVRRISKPGHLVARIAEVTKYQLVLG